ncbi:MAG: methylated-DNA--[protein]-cysteine S-methyltransferase [Gaiellaceae bacterium]
MTQLPAQLDAQVRKRAAEEGLIDVSFGIADSPVGELLIAATGSGICRIAFDPDPEQHLHELAKSFGPRVVASSEPLEAVASQLDEYFSAGRETFDLELDLSALTPFHREGLGALADVPYGTVATYASLAGDAGRPRAARAVGSAMNRNPIPIVLPCHRVVGSDGSLTGYAGGLSRKEALLTLEGVKV